MENSHKPYWAQERRVLVQNKNTIFENFEGNIDSAIVVNDEIPTVASSTEEEVDATNTPAAAEPVVPVNPKRNSGRTGPTSAAGLKKISQKGPQSPGDVRVYLSPSVVA